MDEPGSSNTRTITRQYIFDLMQDLQLPDINKKLDIIEAKLINPEDFPPQQILEMKRKFSYLKSEFKRRWKEASATTTRFLTNNSQWLQGTFALPMVTKAITRSGRPKKSFEDSSNRSKRRKTEELREIDLNTLAYATQTKYYQEGRRDASKVLKDFDSSPKRATKYKKALQQKDPEVNKLSPFEALKMIVEADLTRSQYEVIRSTNKKLYPCYTLVQKAKEDSYPEKEALRVTATCAEVNLEALMAHTCKRLVISLFDVLSTLPEEQRADLTLITKWGCDGSQQTQFRQKFANEADSDKYIFQSSLVPLRLVHTVNNSVIWENPTPSSPRLCRPIRIRFLKESNDITNEEIAYVKRAASEMPEYLSIEVDDIHFKIKNQLILTMVDGKVCNAATDNKSTLRCYICNETSSDFNKLNPERVINQESLNFGLSVLHARIRLFESLLHLSYKLPVKKGRIIKKNKADNDLVEKTKADIQDKFKVQLGLLVDIPKAGFGNTNDGNTSRRFFEDPEKASEITGIDRNLIYRFKVILEAISSGFDVDPDRYNEYAMETARLYVQLYEWCPMTPTMHKILRHGATVIRNAILPIGQLSEEAAEARNKHFKLYRQNFARKFSREECNLDVFNRLLLTSDPLISLSRPKRLKKSKPFLPETVALFKTFENEQEHSDSE